MSEEKILKVSSLDFLRIGMLYNDLKRRITIFRDKITPAIEKKAQIYKSKLKSIYIAISKQYYNFIFKFNNIEGYNKVQHTVVITYDTEFSSLYYTGCDCDGFKKNRICSHLLAVYLWLEEKYLRERREIEQKVKEAWTTLRNI